MRSFFDDAFTLEMLARRQRNADDRVLVTVGRAAQMLRMSRRAVWNYLAAGELSAQAVEGPHVTRGDRVMQMVLMKGEVRRFRQVLEDRRRRAATVRSKQLALPLVVTAPVLRPRSWRLARFKPVMIPAGKALKVHDRELPPPRMSKEKPRVA